MKKEWDFVNIKLILKTLGKIYLIQAGYMALSLLVAIYYGDPLSYFLIPMGLLVATSLPLMKLKVKNTIFTAKDGLVAVALIWLTMSLFGAIPYAIQGGFGTLIDCLFESASGFTTTGATILREVESLPRSILFWRSSTQWLGGMGILVLALALFPSIGERAQNLMAAESPGPTSEKLTARISTSSKILYLIYTSLTLLLILCLYLTGMDLFDCVVNALSTAGTGGFSVLNNSIAGYNNLAAEIVITVFAALFGINFTVFFMLVTGHFRKALKNNELVFYLSTIAVSIAIITANTYSMYRSVGTALRHASFNVVTIITTTGFSSFNYDTWPELSKFIIVFLMLMGASAGSTGGGIKCARVMILCKGVLRELRRMISPKRVSTLRMNGKQLQETTLTNTFAFFVLYFLIGLGACFVISMDNFDFTTTVTSVIACLSNIGPALGNITGPAGNYADFSQLSKVVLSLCMIVGRLEFFPMIALFLPASWKGTLTKKQTNFM